MHVRLPLYIFHHLFLEQLILGICHMLHLQFNKWCSIVEEDDKAFNLMTPHGT